MGFKDTCPSSDASCPLAPASLTWPKNSLAKRSIGSVRTKTLQLKLPVTRWWCLNLWNSLLFNGRAHILFPIHSKLKSACLRLDCPQPSFQMAPDTTVSTRRLSIILLSWDLKKTCTFYKTPWGPAAMAMTEDYCRSFLRNREPNSTEGKRTIKHLHWYPVSGSCLPSVFHSAGNTTVDAVHVGRGKAPAHRAIAKDAYRNT